MSDAAPVRPTVRGLAGALLSNASVPCRVPGYDRVRINVEIIQAGMDRHLWSNSYEGGLRDVFVQQADVAQRIADEIRITLTPPDRARLAKVRASNPDAYLAYSKGRFFWNKRNE